MTSTESEPPRTLLSRLYAWGESPKPAMGLATLITALHWHEFISKPGMLSPLLVASSYLNVGGVKIDSAGMTAVWSGLYLLLALRRRSAWLGKRSTTRRVVQGTALGLSIANCVAGAYVFRVGDREKEAAERMNMVRWGVYKKD